MTATAQKNVRVQRRPLFRTPFYIAALAALLYICIDQFMEWVIRFYGNLDQVAREIHQVTHVVEVGGLTMGAGLYALFRVVNYHPFADRGYSNWLTATPWTVDLPLPMGPVHLVWEDLAVFVVIAAGTWASGGGVLFWLVFSAVLTLYLLLNGVQLYPAFVNYVTAFGWATVVLLWNWPAVTVALATTLLVISQVFLWKALAKFPWQTQAMAEERRIKALSSTKDWKMGPLPPSSPIPLIHGLLLPLLAGWIIFCIISRFPDAAQWSTWKREDLNFLQVMLVIPGAFRWIIYCLPNWSPISKWGRLWTGRWIILAYDYVLLAPLVTSMMGISLPLILKSAGVNPPFAVAISVAAVLACAVNLGPTLRSWQLTGHHRIVISAQNRQAQRRVNNGVAGPR